MKATFKKLIIDLLHQKFNNITKITLKNACKKLLLPACLYKFWIIYDEVFARVC